MFQVKHIPTHHTPSMNIEFQLITLPCHFNTNHFNNIPCKAHAKPIIHKSWITPLMHTHLSHNFNTILKSKQALTIRGQGKRSNITLSRPAPRSGWRVSLRREVVAWARCSLAQEQRGSPERPLAWSSLGEPLLISPRRDMLAWARKLVPTIVLSCNSPILPHNQHNIIP